MNLPGISIDRVATLGTLLFLATLTTCSGQCADWTTTSGLEGTGLVEQPTSAPQGTGEQAGSLAWSMLDDPIVAWVNDQVIRRSQIDDALERRIEAFNRGGRSLTPGWRNAQRRQIVRDLVEEEMLSQALDEEGIGMLDGEVERSIEQEIEQLYHSESQFMRYLERRRMTREEYSEWKRFEMRLERLLVSRGLREPTEQEVEEYYQRHREGWHASERLRAATIVVRLRRDAPPDEVAAARQRIEVLHDLVVVGESDFATVAREYSESPDGHRGGDMGWIYRDDTDLDPGVAQLLFHLEVGQVSEPLRTHLGYQLYLVSDRRVEGVRDFDEVRDNVFAQVRHRMKLGVRAVLLQELEERYDIGYFEQAYGLEPEENGAD